MKILKGQNLSIVLILVLMMSCISVMNMDSAVENQNTGLPNYWPSPEPKVDPVADWQAKFRDTSYVAMLEPLQAVLDEAQAHVDEFDPVLRAIINEVGEGGDEGLTRAESMRYWEDYKRRRAVVVAEQEIREAPAAAAACERAKAVFGAIEYCVAAYNVSKKDCAAALGVSTIELILMEMSSNCPSSADEIQ